VVGWIVLGQGLGLPEWAGMAAVVAANAVSILTTRD
jgi:inner membrane transporter RhtA